MAKAIPDARKDLQLAQCEGTTIHVLSGEPANYGAIAGLMLAEAAITGSYTKSAGSVSGRKNTLDAQTGLPITTTGDATHVCVSDGSSTLMLTTTCATQTLTSGGTVDLSSFAHDITDPT